MDGHWEPPIRCTGRGYPNGPLGAYLGMSRRPNPYWFTVTSFIAQPEWPAVGYTCPLRWFEHQPSTGTTLEATWRWQFTPPAGGISFFRFQVLNAGVAGFQLRLRVQTSVGIIPYNAEYAFYVTQHVATVPAFYLVRKEFHNGPVPSGAWPNEIQVVTGTYANMPAGRCTGGF